MEIPSLAQDECWLHLSGCAPPGSLPGLRLHPRRPHQGLDGMHRRPRLGEALAVSAAWGEGAAPGDTVPAARRPGQSQEGIGVGRRFQLGGDGRGQPQGHGGERPVTAATAAADPAEGCGASRPSLVLGTRGPRCMWPGRGRGGARGAEARAPRGARRAGSPWSGDGSAPRKPPREKRGWGCGSPAGLPRRLLFPPPSLPQAPVPGFVASHMVLCFLNPDALTLLGFPVCIPLSSDALIRPHRLGLSHTWGSLDALPQQDPRPGSLPRPLRPSS